MRDITWKRIPETILAKPADFDKIWDVCAKKASFRSTHVDAIDQTAYQTIKTKGAYMLIQIINKVDYRAMYHFLRTPNDLFS
ncbi:MAG TPA: hypothetical protein DEA91_03385 [Paenibacillus sp.]|nr:hypothetical protein [Paenibacillus sp.]